MRRILKIVAWLAAACVVGVAALLFVAWQMLGSMCRNEVLTEVVSPGGQHKVVVFQRDCGATTGFSTQISLIRANEHLDNDSGNIFVADTNHGDAPSGPGGGPAVSVNWLSSDAVEVLHHPKTRIFLAIPKASGVAVSYRAAVQAAN